MLFSNLKMSSIFYKSGEKLLNSAKTYQNFITNISISPKLLILESYVTLTNFQLNQDFKAFISLYPDRIECYEDETKTKMLFYVLSSNSTLHLIINEMIDGEFKNGFFLSNTISCQAFFFNTLTEYKAWEKALKSTFIQNLVQFKKLYKLVKKIGVGAYSEIYEAYNTKTKKRVALKVMKKKNLKYEDELEALIKELYCLKVANHKNYIQLYEIIEGQTNIYMVMEHFSDGDLVDLLKSKSFSENEALTMLQEIIKQLKYYAKHKILHGDLKLENIMVKKSATSYTPVIIDFGFAQFKNAGFETNYLSHLIGTPGYAAPDMLQTHKKNGRYIYNDSYDIFSLGVIFYCLCYGKFPFCYDNSDELLEENINCSINYHSSKVKLTPVTLSLLKRMLSSTCETRPALNVILLHKAFHKINILRNSYIIQTKSSSLIPSLKMQNKSQAKVKVVTEISQEKNTPLTTKRIFNRTNIIKLQQKKNVSNVELTPDVTPKAVSQKDLSTALDSMSNYAKFLLNKRKI